MAGLSGISAIFAILCFVLLPETLHGASTTKRSFNFLKPIKLFTVPSVGILLAASCLNYGGSGLMLFQFSLACKEIHKVSSWQLGLLLAPYGFGTILGNLCGGKLADFLKKRQGEKGLLILVLLGLTCYPLGLIVFGYLLETSHFPFAVGCTFVVGFSICFCYAPALCFAIARNPNNASAVVAAFQLSYCPGVSYSLLS